MTDSQEKWFNLMPKKGRLGDNALQIGYTCSRRWTLIGALAGRDKLSKKNRTYANKTELTPKKPNFSIKPGKTPYLPTSGRDKLVKKTEWKNRTYAKKNELKPKKPNLLRLIIDWFQLWNTFWDYTFDLFTDFYHLCN